MSKAFPKKIVELEILLVPPANSIQPVMPKPGYRGIPVTLGFSAPIGNYPAQCYMYLDGLQRPTRVCGNEKWQALFLAINLMRKTLLIFDEQGWTMEYYDDGGEKQGGEPGYAVSLEDLLTGALGSKFE